MQADHLNTPRVVMDKQWSPRWRWVADAFGTAAAEENPASKGVFTFNLRFPGQIFDKETGLHYNWHRDYDPGLGRYVQSDPIGLKGGINTYAYVAGLPTLYFDPNGLKWLVDPHGRSPEDIDASTIFCEAGQAKLKLVNQEGECQAIKECRSLHEGIHLTDALGENPNVCQGTTGRTIIINDEDKMRLQSERRAFVAQIACLQKKKEVECESSCKSQINSKLRIMEYFLSQVDRGSYP